MSQPAQPSWEKLSLGQLAEWATGYIIVAIGRGDFRQSVDAMIRQAYSNGYRAHEKEVQDARPRRTRGGNTRRGRRSSRREA